MKAHLVRELLLAEADGFATFGDPRADDLKNFRPELLVFPCHGSERCGLARVSPQTKECGIQR